MWGQEELHNVREDAEDGEGEEVEVDVEVVEEEGGVEEEKEWNEMKNREI